MEQNPYAAPTVSTTQEAPPANPGAPQDWTVSEVIKVGWDAVWKDPLVLIGGMLLVSIIQQAFGQIVSMALPAVDATEPSAVVLRTLMTLPVTLAFGTFFTIGQFRLALAAARNEPVEFATLFSGFDRLVPAFVALMISYVAMALGMVFLIIPGIIIALGLSLVVPLASDTELSVSEVLSESWRLTKGQKMNILGLGFAGVGVILLGLLALCVGVLVAMPLLMVAFAEVYICLTGRRSSAS